MAVSASRVLHGIGRRPLPDDARGFQEAVAARLRASGWTVRSEVPVSSRGDGRRGRVDLVAERDGEVVAIECDRLSPREKSLAKLRAMVADARLVLLRTPRGVADVDGIAVVGVEVEP